MAKIKANRPLEKELPITGAAAQGHADKVLSLIHVGMQDVDSLASALVKFSTALNSRKATDADIAAKLSKAQTDSQKELNRHEEEMARIAQEWEKISKSAEDRERRLSFIQVQIKKFQDEYDRYMVLDIADFLSPTVTSRLESLRKVILELTKELKNP